MTEAVAREQLEDNVVLGTLMLEQDEVDGLVSGAVHTTANTIRPPLQLIKTAPGSSLVSSVFFMLLPEQVYVYGDCAISGSTAEQLAEIAIQSADSAIAFGIEPRVAMLSYSTGTSGAGSDVEKVREATRIAQEKRPDLMIDGPLQYDAAVMADVAKSKAPNSPVAGRATVFIFPDLNTGNTTYKAVQRSADLISIGPMLQGMRKPVNDLSRGALVDDIVYTIALTAIQSSQQQYRFAGWRFAYPAYRTVGPVSASATGQQNDHTVVFFITTAPAPPTQCHVPSGHTPFARNPACPPDHIVPSPPPDAGAPDRFPPALPPPPTPARCECCGFRRSQYARFSRHSFSPASDR